MKIFFLLYLLFFPILSYEQIIKTIAGNGIRGNTGDGGAASAAEITYPAALQCDKIGNIYFSQASASFIRKVSVTGIITTIAGTGSDGYNGDGIAATLAQLNEPCGIAIDSFGNLYIADNLNNRVRKVNITTGIISTIAGTGVGGFYGDGGLADSAELNDPYDVCFDKYGNLYIADSYNFRIRKINPAGIISTVAGNGSTIFSGAGGAATAAGIYAVTGLCTDTIGNLFLADRFVSRILKVDTAGTLTVIAGNGLGYNTGDGGPATAAQINVQKISFDDTGNLYISCIYKNCVRKIDTSGIIHTVVGIDSIAGYSGDGGEADTAELNNPASIDFDFCGNLYITDELNNRIRKVSFYPSCNLDSLQSLSNNFFKINFTANIFPDPASSSSITITSPNNIAKVFISSLIGQTKFSHVYEAEKVEINISNLPLGIYMVAVIDEEGNKTMKKIVKE